MADIGEAKIKITPDMNDFERVVRWQIADALRNIARDLNGDGPIKEQFKQGLDYIKRGVDRNKENL